MKFQPLKPWIMGNDSVNPKKFYGKLKPQLEYGAFIGFVPLILARLFMYIGKIPVENGTPEEVEEEAEEALEEAALLENDQKL